MARVGVRVSTRFEIAEITDRMAKSPDGGKALLFENTGTDFPVLTNMMGSSRRMAMALGVGRLEDITARLEELFGRALAPKSSFADKMRMLPLLAQMSQWLPRVTARRGECQQVVLTGDEADLSLLPVITSWGCDGGAFVTLPMVNTIDPDTGARNVGMYRMQIFDSHTTGMHWHRHKTGARHYEAYARRGERMPVSVALGGDPVYTYAATAPMPDSMDEYLLAGFLRRRPVRLVKCVTNDIYVPADCDFVIEGYVDTSEPLRTEGPFGDHTGFYSLEGEYPVFHVTAITHRRDAVYPATVVGVPPQEDVYISQATERIFLAPIRLALQPEITDLAMPAAGTSHNIAVVALSQRYRGQAFKVAQSMWGAGQMMFNKYMLLAPSGVDIRCAGQIAARLRRIDFGRDLLWSEGVLDVLDHAAPEEGYGSKLAIDLTRIDMSAPEPAMPAVLHTGYTPCGGIELIDTSHIATWGAVVLFAARGEWGDIDVGEYLRRNSLAGVRFALVADYAAHRLPDEYLLWLAAANTDPRRDIEIEGGTMIIDARSKRPGARAGYPVRFPNVVSSLPETIASVTARWEEYGLGEPLPSPSQTFRKLWLSDKAQW